MAVSVSWRRAGQTDIRGLVTAGRAVRLEASAGLKGERGNEKPLLLIVRSRVTSTRCHSRSVTAWWLCVLLLVLGSGVNQRAERRAPGGQAPWPAPLFAACQGSQRLRGQGRTAWSSRSEIATGPSQVWAGAADADPAGEGAAAIAALLAEVYRSPQSGHS